MFKIIPIAAALAGTALTFSISIPAFADEIRVSYADLNLTTVDGRETLERRVNSAARKVCGYDNLPAGSLMPDPAARTCYVKARNQGREGIELAVANKTQNAQFALNQ